MTLHILIAKLNSAINIMQFMLIKLAVSITREHLFVLNLTKHVLKQFHEIFFVVEYSFIDFFLQMNAFGTSQCFGWICAP